MLSLTLLLTTIPVLVVGETGQCSDGWTFYGNSCYSYFNMKENFLDAVRLCETMGGASLAEIETEMENVFLRNYMRMQNCIVGAWIGGNDRLAEGMWVWDKSGQPITYFDWHHDQPDDNGVKSQDCLTMFKSYDFQWGDIICGTQLGVLCEAPAV